MAEPAVALPGEQLATPAEPAVAPSTTPDDEGSDTVDAQNDPQIWDAITADLAKPVDEPGKATALPQLDLSGVQWQRAVRPDGTAQVSVKKPLPLDWDTRIGADLSPASQSYDPAQQPLPDVRLRGTGATWLNIAVPNVAALELRANADSDNNRLGASLSRSLPLGRDYSLSFESKFALVEPAGFSTLPSALAQPARTWNTDKLLKFNILSSGTTLLAGTTTSTLDNVTHSKLAAEQKIYGPFNITTALTDLGGPTAAKSISAGFRMNW